MSPVSASPISSNGGSPAAVRHRFLDRPVPKKLLTRYSSKIWDDWLPIASRISPKVISRFSGLMNSEDFARSIAGTSDETLAVAMQSPMRGVVLDEVVKRMEIEFLPEKAYELDAVFHFLLSGRSDGGHDDFQMTIREGTCVASKTLSEEAKVTLMLDAVDFMRLVTGFVTGIDLYVSGKLKIDGAMMLGTRVASMFNIPKIEATPATS